METEAISTEKKRFFDRLLHDYFQKICEVIQVHQHQAFGYDEPVVFKKDLLRHFGMSGDLARKVIDFEVTETNTMMHVLDTMENVLELYDPHFQIEGRKALIMRKFYFFRTYVCTLDMEKPIVQRGNR